MRRLISLIVVSFSVLILYSQSMGSDDIYINFYYFNNNQECLAYIQDPLDTRPHIVETCINDSNKYINPTDLDDFYNSYDARDYVWGNILPYLANKKNIYFSVSGPLCGVGIEYLPYNSEMRFNEYFNMYRISTIRKKEEQTSNEKAVLYGGLTYSMTDEDLLAEHIDFSNSPLFVYKGAESNSTRGSLSFLEHTIQETAGIDTILRNHNYLVSIKQGKQGTEESIKFLSGDSLKILHLATHGFYSKGQSKGTYKNAIEWMLSHSGLYLAGANYSKAGGKANEFDDGILSADEIINLDLSHIDIVTLSACQSGLGDIVDNKVYGLQYALKYAGANTLLVSLWEVNDKATSIFMQSFYSHLAHNKTATEALRRAQKDLIAFSPKYKSPYYWAAFILIDAVTCPTDIEQMRYDEEEELKMWNQAKLSIDTTSVVISFKAYQRADGQNEYLAAIYNPRSEHPHIIQLPNLSGLKIEPHFESEVENVFELVDSLVWNPLLPYINGKKTIYFIPCAQLTQIPIECSSLLWDTHKVYRISSIDQIKYVNRIIPISNISLFGGCVFDNVDGKIWKRLKFLPGTKWEVENVYKITSNSITTRLYTSAQANECSFRKCLQNPPSIIHVATHGAYATLNRHADYIQELNNSAFSVTEALNGRTLFILSNSFEVIDSLMTKYEYDNTYDRILPITPDTISEELIDTIDGVISGKDIMKYDLRQVDLVVLTSADSGKGAYGTANSYGLINALKQAGAKSILCCFWPTNDAACVVLIQEFYKGLAHGMNKREAFRKAQEVLKEIYEEPANWASFIMID